MRYITPVFLLAALVLFSCSSEKKDANESKQPNILFIIVDDMNTDIHPYGGPALTPNLQRLASEGVQFNHAYVQEPVCAASRASFLTGLRPNTTGVNYPYSCYFVEDLLPEKGSMTRFFKQNGYLVKQFGKYHHGYEDENPTFIPNDRGKYISDSIRQSIANGGPKPPYEMITEGGEEHYDPMVADSVVTALKAMAESDQPFFFAAGFSKPHLVFAAPEKYWDLYDRNAIETPVPKELGEGIPRLAVDQYYLNQYNWETDDPMVPFSDDYARLIRHSYYASTSFVDAQVGRLLDALEESGLEEETVVIFMADHGFLMGEHNYWGKTNLFEKGLRVPMFLSWKGHIKGGQKINALVEAVDIFPTLADLAGFPIPEYLEGTSMKALTGNPELEWKKGALSQQPRSLSDDLEGTSIRTERYRYTEWFDEIQKQVLARELYDYQADPTESVNLAELPENAGLVEELSALLNSGWKALLPPGMENSSDNPLAPPAYAWGPEGDARRKAWHARYGGNEEDGWRKAIETRRAWEANNK